MTVGADSKPLDVRRMELTGHVGFSTLPDQLVSKVTSDGFTFNIMIVGETGIGKSTMMDTLFNTHFDNVPSGHECQEVQLRKQTYLLQESSVRLRLTIVETVGFGDQINKEQSSCSHQVLADYIDSQFEAFLQEELKIKRNLNSYHDSRVHCCLYMICPTGHTLKSIDLVTMKKLDSRVNIIPLIAKADTINKSELAKFKLRIMSELAANGVQIYQFPTDEETVADSNSAMNGHLPFAVVGSTDMVKFGNKMVRARQYPWGVVQVDNENHCDFVKLREMLLRTNMQDIVDTTHRKHYETFRRNRLAEMGFSDSNYASVSEAYESQRESLQNEMQDKEERLKQSFVQKIKDKESELKDQEKDLHTKYEKMKREHAEEKRRLEEKKKHMEDEISDFLKRKVAMEQARAQQSTLKGKKK